MSQATRQTPVITEYYRLKSTIKSLEELKQLNCEDDELMDEIGRALNTAHSKMRQFRSRY